MTTALSAAVPGLTQTVSIEVGHAYPGRGLGCDRRARAGTLLQDRQLLLQWRV